MAEMRQKPREQLITEIKQAMASHNEIRKALKPFTTSSKTHVKALTREEEDEEIDAFQC